MLRTIGAAVISGHGEIVETRADLHCPSATLRGSVDDPPAHAARRIEILIAPEDDADGCNEFATK